jgi:glycerol-3-phosphate dehydrogenase
VASAFAELRAFRLISDRTIFNFELPQTSAAPAKLISECGAGFGERTTTIEQANIVIIGGGVIGCAIARALAAKWDDVFLLEALPKVGMGASTRNSGVIHAGLYYQPGSLKARHCLRGSQLLYEFCAAHHVPHRRTGKIVVAVAESEGPELLELLARARTNGVEGLQIIDRAAIRAREPHVQGFQAILVPSTGIVESEELVKAYARLATDRGAHIVTNARVEKCSPGPQTIRVSSAAGEIETRCLINSAGLYADEVAAMLGSNMAQHKIYPVRGEYCELIKAKRDMIRELVYPLPHNNGLSLGVHFTKTVSGSVWIGPTARYVESKSDYERDREPLEYFAKLAKRLLPELEATDMVPAHSGIRAKLAPPPHLREPGDTGTADFIIERDPQFPQVVQLMGLESPGLTSSLSIAEQVTAMVSEML